MLKPGTYRLSADVKNPHPDRRKRGDWTARSLFEAGSIFVVLDSASVPIIKRVNSSHHDRLFVSDERALALEPHLQPIDETIGAMFLRLDVYSWYLPAFLRYLIESGVMSSAEFERHHQAWLSSDEEE